ncbi:MAG: S8 family serine peptidase [Chloroflexi bacterium]|nr:S8 family serine peptidase [Chloroflexota bacterium]
MKLRPEVALGSVPGRAFTTNSASLDGALRTLGVTKVIRVFPTAKRPTVGAIKRIAGEERPAPDLTQWYRLAFAPDSDVLKAVTDLTAEPSVIRAEPNYLFTFDGVPDDPYFSQQWHLHNTGQYHLADADIDAPEAWDIITGIETIVIAVIDTGVDRDHADLTSHIWTNPGEIPGNSVDDDGNGYVDDTWGWNWASDYPTDPDDFRSDNPRDDNGHGTHVAGIASAVTNNGVGVAGVCWNCKVMALKAFESNGTATTDDIVQAINYAANKGADVINMSFGSYAESLLLEDTLADAYGRSMLVAAAGNDGKTSKATKPFYPAAYSYVLGVGATDVGCAQRDPITLACLLVAEYRADFSNYGVNADVGAPGVSIYSTFRGGGYASMSGTSMAAPIVSGVAALLLSQHPTWSKEMARGQIVKTPDPIYVQPGTIFTPLGNGRINAYSALTVVPTPDLQLVDNSILYGDSSGDADGIPDASETFTITMLLKNTWGEAQGTTAVLSSTDPYVTILNDMAAFGDISAYATMRNEGTPFQMALDSAAPNNHQVDFSLAVSANSGAYITAAAFSFRVQRGIELPGPLFPAVITQSMTLHNDYLYIVKQNMLVSQGVTFTIEPGTRLQYDPGKFIKIQGTLIASGTAELPIYFTSNQKEPKPGDFQGIIFDDQATDAVLNPTLISTTLAAEGTEIPGVGTVISITNTPRFDTAGDVFFSAIITGSPNEQLLHWFNGVGLIEVSNDPLPSESSTTPYSETVSLVDTGSNKSVVFARPNDEYVSGSILNHVVLEYGGGLLIDDSFPYIVNSTFRQNQGAIPTGTNSPFGAIVIDRQSVTDNSILVIQRNTISDNPSHGLYIKASGAGQLNFSRNTVQNNIPLGQVTEYYRGAGVFFDGGNLAIYISGNTIEYNQTDQCGGIYGTGADAQRLRLEGNTLRRNRASTNTDSGGGGGVCFEGASALLRRNVIASDVEARGYQTGNSAAQGGGSALYLYNSAPIAQFNTILGNQARPGQAPRTAPGETVFFVRQRDLAQLTHNNILGNQASFDLYLSNYNNGRKDMDARQNFWGTTDVNAIRYGRIFDYWQDFNPGEATFQPFLTTPELLAPGFLLSATTDPFSPIGAQPMNVTLDFSREMDTAITPTATFGVVEPYTQHRIENGGWISATRWMGTFDVDLDTGDGINTLKVQDATDTSGMTIPEDTRFSFIIQTAGTSAILLEAIAGVGQVALNWTQNDVADLAGYILYRSVMTNTAYSQVGPGMFVTTAFTDTTVTNAVMYYYKYSILDTDFNEVAWSNEVSVTPDDYTPPTTPAVTDDGASTHYFDRLYAVWTSADPETGVVEYQYCIGKTAGGCDTVGWTSVGTITKATRSGLNLFDAQTYYVNVKARNGANHWSMIGFSDGIVVDKLAAPSLTSVTPSSSIRSVAHTITVTGSAIQTSPLPTVQLGQTPLGDVVVLDATRLTAVVPAGCAAGVYTVTVTNFDTQSASLSSAYTATNPVYPPAPVSPSTQAHVGLDEASLTVNVTVENVNDLRGFQFDLAFDPAILQATGVGLGSLLGSTGLNTFIAGQELDNVAGRVRFGAGAYGAAPSSTGAGVLATVTFAPASLGTSSLTLQNVVLADSLSMPMATTEGSAQVRVVTYPTGDLDRSCLVDIYDIMFVANRWNTHTGNPNYLAAYDFDSDGDIDILDIMVVANQWNASCPGGALTQSASWTTVEQPGYVFHLRQFRETGDLLAVELHGRGTVVPAAYQTLLAYDPASLAPLDVQPGPGLARGVLTLPLGPQTAQPGRVAVGAFVVGAADVTTESALLGTVRFRVLNRGGSGVRLLGVQAADRDGAAIPLTVQDQSYWLWLPLTISGRP